jgi:hypothetical protein
MRNKLIEFHMIISENKFITLFLIKNPFKNPANIKKKKKKKKKKTKKKKKKKC